MVLWDGWLRGQSLKAIGRAFGKPSSLFIACWPPVLRRPVEITGVKRTSRGRKTAPRKLMRRTKRKPARKTS